LLCRCNIRIRLLCCPYVWFLCRYRVSVSVRRPMLIRKRTSMLVRKRTSMLVRKRTSMLVRIRTSMIVRKWVLKRKRLSCIIRLSCLCNERVLKRKRCLKRKWVLKRKRCLKSERRLYINRSPSACVIWYNSKSNWHNLLLKVPLRQGSYLDSGK
jgi:hypothetical protein